MTQKFILLIISLLAAGLTPVHAFAPGHQQNIPLPYTPQTEDTLPRLADKYYRDPLAWPAIWLFTNRLAKTDSRFPPIENPRLLLPGRQVAIPAANQVTSLIAKYLAAGYSPPGVSPTKPLTADWLADFAAYVDNTRQHFDIPGVAVAVVRNNQIVLAQGFGLRELGQPEKVTPETMFAIGSTTKAMNSMLVASLVDDKLLTWEQPVTEIWPNFTLSNADVTSKLYIRDLLNMSSGLPRADLIWSGSGMSAEQVMESLAELPMTAPPGERFQYNNQIVATGGYVATLAAGGTFGNLETDYANLLTNRLFAPIGMATATLSVDKAQAHPNHATPHDFTLNGDVRPTAYHADPGITPAGGVNATLLDMARFLQTQLNRGSSPTGRRVVSAKNLTETWQPQIAAYPDTSYAMGWFVENYQGIDMVWHDGDVLGFKSLLVFVPEANTGLVLLTNRTISYGFSNSVRYQFIEALYGLDVEAGEFFKTQWTNFITALPAVREPLNAAPSPADVAPYLGSYTSGWRVEQHDDDSLWAVRGQYGWQLWAKDNGNFTIGNGFGFLTPLEFTKSETGTVTMSFKLSTGELGSFQKFE